MCIVYIRFRGKWPKPALNLLSKWISFTKKVSLVIHIKLPIVSMVIIELGMPMTEIDTNLGISVSTVSVAVKMGRKLVDSEGLNLTRLLNLDM